MKPTRLILSVLLALVAIFIGMTLTGCALSTDGKQQLSPEARAAGERIALRLISGAEALAEAHINKLLPVPYTAK